jgi:polyprenyldihydroxybenzoate methyltransferase / 3-demethylubiquinol 3-O-methyltransferase
MNIPISLASVFRRSWIPARARGLHTVSHSTEPQSSSVNPSEIAHFSRLSSLWWDEHGEFSFLHKMNPVRMQFVREKVLEITREEHGEEAVKGGNPLEGLDILDVGCGGGLLSEVRRLYCNIPSSTCVQSAL